MRTLFLALMMTMVAIVPGQAVEFLGIELCTDSISTAVVLPLGSPLTLESAEVGAQGALVLLLRSDDKQILSQIDDLMADVTGSRGVGDGKSLQWSGRQITAFAQVLKSKLAALAVNTSDDCQGTDEATPAATEPGPSVSSEKAETYPDVGLLPPVAPVAPVAEIAIVPVAPVEPEPLAERAEEVAPAGPEEPAFSLEGALQHWAYSDDWVDVMGVVVNNTVEGYKTATFDLSMYDDSGSLICVDTISVAILKSGQHRAFRDSIQCPGYTSDAVDRIELQFAGGH